MLVDNRLRIAIICYVVPLFTAACGTHTPLPEEPAAVEASLRADGVDRRFEKRTASCKKDPRVLLGLMSVDTCVGAELFFRETFGGNGRTCGSCHPSANNFTLDPSFIETLADDDPVFVAEHKPGLEDLEFPELLRDHGLFRVNADGFDDPANKFVMRSVPHTLSLATSISPPPSEPGWPVTIDGTPVPPLQRLGWSGDGAPGSGTLRDFADGAIVQHASRSLDRTAGTDFRLPSDPERDAMATFMLGLGRKNEIDLEQVALNDAAAERGRLDFLTGPAQDCSLCHDSAGANSLAFDDETNITYITNFSFDVGTERARLPILASYATPFDGGFGIRPFDSNGDGVNDAYGNGAFNTPPLIEAADTGPFFHTNAANTIEDAVRFYTTPEFGQSLSGRAPSLMRPMGGPFQLTDVQIDELGRFLRVLNAALNCQQAMARLSALGKIARSYGCRYESVQRGLTDLTLSEVSDALEDLSVATDFYVDARAALEQARCALEDAKRGHADPQRAYARALERVTAANTLFGTGMTFELGDANLAF